MLLALDTSTDMASIAIVQDGGLLAELTWRCGENHSVELLPRLTRLLEMAKLDIKSARGIIVARGPGSFNGLRVGISTAKGLAFSLGVPLVGISTLEAAAYQHAETGLPICSIFNAGRGEITAALYQLQDGEWRQLIAEHLTTLEDICSQVTTETVFCGEYALVIADELKKRLGQRAVIPPAAAMVRRAGFLAELGRRRLDAGTHDDPATLQPIYLRRPHITQPKQDWRQYGQFATDIR